MRYIGNKRKILPHIEAFLRDRRITGGTFCDIFTGTTNVACHFKRLGFRIVANDIMWSSYVFQAAYIENGTYPRLEGFLGAPGIRPVVRSREFAREFAREGGDEDGPDAPLRRAVFYLNAYAPRRRGLFFRAFSPGGAWGRMYFREEHAKKIDGILDLLRRSLEARRLRRTEFYLLLASLIDAVDRVANISGTYGAFHKTWQSNTENPLRLQPPEVIPGNRSHRIYREDGNRLIRRIRPDVLYIDPPYNGRQYPANYHCLEVAAQYHRIKDLRAFERDLLGKTGLPPQDERRSLYCLQPSVRNREGNARTALEDLIRSARARHIVVSYNEEGIVSRDEIGRMLAGWSGRRRFPFRRDFLEVAYRRFRSDSDREGRSYRVIADRGRDEVHEWLFYAGRR